MSFKIIESITVGSGGITDIVFSNIPQTYTDLMILHSIRNSRNSAGPGYLRIAFNDITTSLTGRTLYNGMDPNYGAGVDIPSLNYISYSLGIDWLTAGSFGNGKLYIPEYTSSNYKNIFEEGVMLNNGTPPGIRSMGAFIWSNTSAINKITLITDGAPFLQHSSATLYGIKNS